MFKITIENFLFAFYELAETISAIKLVFHAN